MSPDGPEIARAVPCDDAFNPAATLPYSLRVEDFRLAMLTSLPHRSLATLASSPRTDSTTAIRI